MLLISEGCFYVQIISPSLGCTCGWALWLTRRKQVWPELCILKPALGTIPHPIRAPWTFQSHKCRSYRSKWHPQLSLHCISHWLHDQTKILTLGRLCSTAVQRRAAESLSHLSSCWSPPAEPGPLHQLPKHSGAVKELLGEQTAFKGCDQPESSAIHRLTHPLSRALPTTNILHLRKVGIPWPHPGFGAEQLCLEIAFMPSSWTGQKFGSWAQPKGCSKSANTIPVLTCIQGSIPPWQGWQVKSCSQQSWGSVPHLCSDLWSSIPCALWQGNELSQTPALCWSMEGSEFQSALIGRFPWCPQCRRDALAAHLHGRCFAFHDVSVPVDFSTMQHAGNSVCTSAELEAELLWAGGAVW